MSHETMLLKICRCLNNTSREEFGLVINIIQNSGQLYLYA